MCFYFLALAQEENSMGRFLKESGKQDKTRAGEMMCAVGKALSTSGQQRLYLGTPLLGLHEVSTVVLQVYINCLLVLLNINCKSSFNYLCNVKAYQENDKILS